MIIRKTYADLMQPLTDEQRAELEALKDIEPEPDDENPAQTPEQLAKFRRVSDAARTKKDTA